MKYFISALIIIAAILLIYIFLLVRPAKKRNIKKELLCSYAHRGLYGNGIPENSKAAFSKAVDAGVGIELDVQLSKDGTVMVFHDYTLDRMTGKTGKVCETETQALTSTRLDGTNDTIPTLQEVLELVDGRVPLLIELKGEDLRSDLCPAVAQLLKGYRGNYCIESFNPLLLMNMRKHLPDAFYGQLYTNVCKSKGRYTPLNIILTLMAFNLFARPNFIAYDQQYRGSLPVLLTTKLFKAPRFVWTVKTAQQLEIAKANNECAIFENL